MFGLGFLAPLFVAAGIIGASIPIILHLLNRERARRLVFSTVRFHSDVASDERSPT